MGLDIARLTGMPLSTYPSAVKLVWLLEHVPKVKEAYDAGKLAFGTVDTWLLYNLNGKDRNYFVTDSTNASRTMFMNLHTVQYDKQLLDFFGLDANKLHLPRIVPSSDAKAYGKMASGALEGKRIAGCLGDQSAALVGQQGMSFSKYVRYLDLLTVTRLHPRLRKEYIRYRLLLALQRRREACDF